MRHMGLRFLTILLLFLLTLSGTASLMLPATAWAEEETVYITEGATHDAVPVAETSAEEHQAKKIGFPQLKTETYATQVFWLIIAFIALYTLMSKAALPRIGQIIERRQEQRHGDLDAAQQMHQDAQKIREAFEAELAKSQAEAQKQINTAMAEAADRANAESARFVENAQKRTASAEQGITRAKLDAQQSIGDVVAEISADIVNKIAGTQLTKAEAKRAVTTAAQQEG